MGAQSLGSRGIIGSFYNALEVASGQTWIGGLAMRFTSDQESETYKWLGMSPALREWIGGRHAKGFRDNGLTITNKTWEATLEVLVDELRRDKTPQIRLRIAELAQRAVTHDASLLSTLILNGEGSTSGLAYDGQFFFDDDHSEGNSGTQDNDITYDVTTTTAPTVTEFQGALLQAAQTMLGFKDDQGEPMNEMARNFLVMVPTVFWSTAAGATTNPFINQGDSNTILNLDGYRFALATNPRLTWTTKFALFRTDGQVKPFIVQEEEGVTVSALAEGSEEEFKNNRHLYGIKRIANVGFGYWQHAVLVTFV